MKKETSMLYGINKGLMEHVMASASVPVIRLCVGTRYNYNKLSRKRIEAMNEAILLMEILGWWDIE